MTGLNAWRFSAVAAVAVFVLFGSPARAFESLGAARSS